MHNACVLSRVQLFVTPWTVACQAPLSVEFSRQESWSRVPVPTVGDLPNPGIKPALPALAGRFFTTEPPEGYTPALECLHLEKKKKSLCLKLAYIISAHVLLAKKKKKT